MRRLLIVCFALCVIPAHAQQATARLLGTILDPSGAAIGNATVSVTNIATSQQKTVQTNTSGEYSIPLLPIGEYTMRVEAPGFQTKALKGIILQVDQEARLDVAMALGSTTEAVTVQAEAPLPLIDEDSAVGPLLRAAA